MKKSKAYIVLLSLLLSALFSSCPTQLSANEPADSRLTEISRVWDEFTTALHRGEFSAAYSRLSPLSRQKVAYRDFCVDWHPINTKYNIILSNPNFSDFSIFGNVAAVRIGIDPNLAESESKFIRILLTNKDNKWWIVAENVQQETVTDAAIRGLLQDIVQESVILNKAFTTGKGSLKEIQKELPRLFTARRGKLALNNYTLELDLLRDSVLRAIPDNKDIPAYQIDSQGTLCLYKRENRINNLSSREILQMRKQKKETARRRVINEQKKKLQVAERKLRKIKEEQRSKLTLEDEDIPPITHPAIASLPDAPPEFPQEFTLKGNNTTSARTNKIKFLGQEEDFDLPEIDGIEFKNKKRQKTRQKNSDRNFSEDTRAMAPAGDEQLYPTSVELNNNQLLNELEEMLKEYQEETE